MSGGSWDYAYTQLEEISDRLMEEKDPLRKAFGKKMRDFALAMHAIEWVDSGDCSHPDDEIAIREALGEGSEKLELAELIEEAKDVSARLNEFINGLKKT